MGLHDYPKGLSLDKASSRPCILCIREHRPIFYGNQPVRNCNARSLCNLFYDLELFGPVRTQHNEESLQVTHFNEFVSNCE